MKSASSRELSRAVPAAKAHGVQSQGQVSRRRSSHPQFRWSRESSCPAGSMKTEKEYVRTADKAALPIPLVDQPAQSRVVIDGVRPVHGDSAYLRRDQRSSSNQREDEKQQCRGELCGGGAVVHTEPGAENTGGEGADTEVLHGAIIRKGLHQGQAQAGHHGGPGQRQGDAEEGAPGAVTQGCDSLPTRRPTAPETQRVRAGKRKGRGSGRA